jgi:hypothetical protein
MKTPRRINDHLIELTDCHNDLAIVNQAHISYVSRHSDGCAVRIGNESISIKDRYEDIVQILTEK